MGDGGPYLQLLHYSKSKTYTHKMGFFQLSSNQTTHEDLVTLGLSRKHLSNVPFGGIEPEIAHTHTRMQSFRKEVTGGNDKWNVNMLK